MISGHRRKSALELNGVKESDAYIKELTNYGAIIFMICFLHVIIKEKGKS